LRASQTPKYVPESNIFLQYAKIVILLFFVGRTDHVGAPV